MPYRRTPRIQERLDSRYAALIAAAQAIAAEQGMGAVQIAPVASRAGIAAGTVYRYFPSKVSLVTALAEAEAVREAEALQRAADTSPGPLSALTTTVVTIAARLMQRPRLSWALLGEPVESEIQDARLRFRRTLVAEVATRLEAARAAQPIAGENNALAAAALGACVECLIGPTAPAVAADVTARRESVQTAALFALRGLGLPDARARGLVSQVPLPDFD
jgi:AcrR family transcriptional regulator